LIPVTRFRVSKLAQSDLARILTASESRWGAEGRRRYAALIEAAMRQVGDEPEGVATRDRNALHRGTRSLHLKYVRAGSSEAKVKNPVHILYYRSVHPELVEIIRVLHERMDPNLHIGAMRRK
jgi:toxin ParE1/3/4